MKVFPNVKQSGTDSSAVVSEVLAVLRCLGCSGDLDDRGDELVCSHCDRKYPRVNGVIRFVEPENYAGSFGFQWQRYARTQLDTEESRQSEIDFGRRTGLTPADLKGKLVLDVGCGMGRFADIATRWGALVVGVDLSAAAEVAARNLAGREFVALQADAFALPFAAESFDYIYSIGVLHHTPDCEQAVKNLPQYLKPGGTLAVWLYSAYNPWYRFSDMYRRFTTRMSPQLLHGILRVAVPVVNGVDSALRVVPIVGKPMSGFVRHVLPVNRNPKRQWRVLDTFDWYSPKYQSKHTYEQVFRWFESCGLKDLHVGEVAISVRGTKPLA
jgi:SAM-dependent methyltransferase